MKIYLFLILKYCPKINIIKTECKENNNQTSDYFSLKISVLANPSLVWSIYTISILLSPYIRLYIFEFLERWLAISFSSSGSVLIRRSSLTDLAKVCQSWISLLDSAFLNLLIHSIARSLETFFHEDILFPSDCMDFFFASSFLETSSAYMTFTCAVDSIRFTAKNVPPWR